MDRVQIDYGVINIDPDMLAKASDGDSRAQLEVGKIYFSSVYIEDNCLSAFKWLSESAQQGNMEAQFRLGDLYALGQGTQKSFEDAYRWYTKAALQGYKKALIRIHNLYQEDKKMYCRGQLNSDEEEWASDEFKKKNNIRELNEYRREQQAFILNNAVDYYTDQFKFYKSFDQEDMETQLYLAFFYQHGYGAKKYGPWAIEFYTKAAEQGHRDAQYNLGYLYQHNTNIIFNYRHAFKWYTLSANNGNIAAQNCLGYFYEKGLATELNYKDALYWYTQAAISGNSNAQLTLGRLYRKGQGIEQNISEAVKWYKLAASQGNTVAQNCLNQLHLNGKLPKATTTNTVSEHAIEPLTAFALSNKLQNDINKLYNMPQFEQLKILAHQVLRRDINAMFNVGMKYYIGEDLPQDKDTGFQWIKKAGKAGLQEAELKLAELYEEGNTVDQDYYQSAIWSKKSAKKRNSISQKNLGLLYKKGLGVRKDPLEASKWFIWSSHQENGDAQYQFSLLRRNGEGVGRDFDEADYWTVKAALNGNTDALYQIAEMYGQYRIADVYERNQKISRLPLNDSDTKIASEIRHIFINARRHNDQAFTIYKLAAKYGSKDAYFKLGEIYEEGKTISQDREKAHEYYIKAADSGDPIYQTELAIKYLNREFEDTDYTRAFDLLKKAADKNEPRASGIFQIPMDYKLNVKNYLNFIDMLTSASTKGIEKVDYKLGHIYEHGIYFEGQRIFDSDYGKSKLFYSLAAKKNDPRAQYRLGVIYEEGKGVTIDLQIAIEYYNQAYKNGNKDAAYSLGLIYLNGSGVSQDLIKSFYLFSEASEMGHTNAYKMLKPSDEKNILSMLESAARHGNVSIQYQLGTFYEYKNDLKSFEWLTSATQCKISNAYYRLGVLYEEGRGTSRDYSRAIKLYETAVTQNHEDAMYKLAQMYHHSVGTSLDYEKAYELYNKAAKSGHCLSLKILNITGNSNLKAYSSNNEKTFTSSLEHENTTEMFPFTSDEFKHSLMMYKYIAEHGNTEAQYILGVSYENSFNDFNYSEAVNWYTIASEKSHQKAIYRLGLLYEEGLGVIQNYHEASRLYQKSYEQGNYDALYRLGTIYLHGTTGNADPVKAIQYYTEAAIHGQSKAQYALGIIFEQGELCEQDILTALKWYTISYLQGNDDARQTLSDMYATDLPFERFFHNRLYNIINSALNKFESYSYLNDSNDKAYGRLYYTFGYLHLYGLGTSTDYSKAWKYIRKSIKDFDCKDRYRLLETDSIEKFEMRTVAADSGDVDAQYDVGKYHYTQAVYKRAKLYKKKCTTITDTTTELDNNRAIFNHNEKTLRYFSLSASKGHRNSQYYLGKIYQNGYGTAIDYEQAKLWYTESSQRKHRGAQHGLGMVHLNGATVDQDYPEALLHLNRAAKEGNEDSLFQLGWMYEHGIGVSEDKTGALQYFQDSIEAMQRTSNPNYNDEDSNNLSDSATNLGDDQDLETDDANKLDGLSIIELQELSEKGNNEASYILSQKFFNGIDIEKDYAKSITYLRNAAYQGHTVSQEELALSYYYGANVLKDIRVATMWFRTGVKKSSSVSTFYLAQIYHSELLDKPDFSNAFKLYKEADGIYRAIALQGTGLLYEHGDGFKTNYSLALRYYNESFIEGNTLSGYNIASMYFHGKGVKQDYVESIYWLENALQEVTLQSLPYVFIEVENSFEATLENKPKKKYSVIFHNEFLGEINYLLGRIYYEGLGVQQDVDRSYGYFSEAEEKGKTKAKVQLDEIKEIKSLLQRNEDEKKAIKNAKLQLKKSITAAKIELKKVEEINQKLGTFERSKYQSEEITEAGSLSKIEIDEMKKPFNKEIEESEKLLYTEETKPRPKEEFDGASSRLKKSMDEFKPTLKIIEQAELALEKIKKEKLELKEKIKEAEALQGKVEEAKEQLRKIRSSKIQSSEIDEAKSLREDDPKKVLGQFAYPIKQAKKWLNETGEITSLLCEIERAKNQLLPRIKKINDWLDIIEQARLELKKIEWEQERKRLNNC